MVGYGRILAWQRVKLPRYGREGAVEVRPFPAEKTPCISMAQGLSGEAVKGDPMTTVIPRVDESKSSRRTTEDSTEPQNVIAKPFPSTTSQSMGQWKTREEPLQRLVHRDACQENLAHRRCSCRIESGSWKGAPRPVPEPSGTRLRSLPVYCQVPAD